MNTVLTFPNGPCPITVVKYALEILQNRANHGLNSPIVSFRRPSRHSELGSRRVQYVVTLENGDEVALQIKTSSYAMQKYLGWAKKCKSLIFAIFVPQVIFRRSDNFQGHMESVIRKIVDTLNNAVNIMRRAVIHTVHQMRKEGRPANPNDAVVNCRARNKPPQFYRPHLPCMCH